MVSSFKARAEKEHQEGALVVVGVACHRCWRPARATDPSAAPITRCECPDSSPVTLEEVEAGVFLELASLFGRGHLLNHLPDATRRD